MFALVLAILPVIFPKLMLAPMLRQARARPLTRIFGYFQIFHSIFPSVSLSRLSSTQRSCASTFPYFFMILKTIVAAMTEMMTVFARSKVMNQVARATAIEEMPEYFSASSISIETSASITPTPAIIALTMTGPISSTIFSLRPSDEGMRRKSAPQNTRLILSRGVLPSLPATAIVSAWKDIVATELKAKEPAAPMRKAIAVGKAAKPSESESSPCGTPFMTTASAVSRSVAYDSI